MEHLDLSDPIWTTLNGAYGVTYDASKPLKRLEAAKEGADLTLIWEELWVELHHKGAVGLVSFLAVPQLIRIAQEKNIADWNIPALCSTIEQQRVLGDENPRLPSDYNDAYFNALDEMKAMSLKVADNEDASDLSKTIAMCAIATANGQFQLGKAIMQFADEDLLKEFLIQF
ncbi:MAG: hypothetical protein AB8F78_01490 [Saprospiraceae bacterium]